MGPRGHDSADLWLSISASVNGDDDESEESESEAEDKKHEGQHHAPSKSGRRKTLTELSHETEPDVLDPFPLHIELKTSYKGKRLLTLTDTSAPYGFWFYRKGDDLS